MGRGESSRPILRESDREFFAATHFSFFHLRSPQIFSRKKSLRREKTFPIFTRHQRMALLLPDSSETSDEQNR
jgi:hypothetical protein